METEMSFDRDDVKNYYEVLEIPTDATQDEIQQAYNRAKNAYSGDSVALYSLMSEDECKAILGTIEEAHAVLSQPDKRREYDKVRGINSNPINSRHTYTAGRSVTIYEETPAFQRDAFFERKDLPERSVPQPEPQFHQPRQQINRDLDDSFNMNRKETIVSKVAAQNRFALHYNVSAQFEQEIENATLFNGEFLRKIREYKNVELDRMSEMTKISRSYLQSIENEDFDKLPAAAYTRGFVFQIAKVLKLNPDIVASSYMAHFKAAKNAR